MVDQAGGIVAVNEREQEVLGYKHETLLSSILTGARAGLV